MFALNTRKLSTTLFISLAVLVAISTVVEASHDIPQARGEHGKLRIVKVHKRQDFPLPVIGAAPIPDASSAAESGTGVPDISTASAASTATSETASATESATSSASSTESTSSTASSASTTQSTSSTPAAAETTPTPTAAPVTGTRLQTKTLVKSVEAQSTSEVAELTGGAQTSSNIATVLLIVVASLGGIAVLWTIFRKWKLSSSKKFEDRLQPIDWRTPSHDDDGIIPPNRRTSGASFQSKQRSNLQPIPDHDFTAPAASPVGGYADMNRGPSPGPLMREQRGYEFGAPIHSTGRY